MSYHIGHERWSNDVRPFYGMVSQSRRRAKDGIGHVLRWHWHLRSYDDGSTACRGPGDGFSSKAAAEEDMERFLRTVARLDLDVKDQ